MKDLFDREMKGVGESLNALVVDTAVVDEVVLAPSRIACLEHDPSSFVETEAEVEKEVRVLFAVLLEVVVVQLAVRDNFDIHQLELYHRRYVEISTYRLFKVSNDSTIHSLSLLLLLTLSSSLI